MNNKIKHIILAILSLAFVVGTLFIYTKIDNQNELKKTRLGYPAYFLEQNSSSLYGKQPFFPTWDKLDLSGKAPVVSFNSLGFLVDFILIFSGFELLIYVLEALDFAIRKKR